MHYEGKKCGWFSGEEGLWSTPYVFSCCSISLQIKCLKGFPVSTDWEKLIMPLIILFFNEFRANLDKTQKCHICNNMLQATNGKHFMATLLSVLF